MNLIHFLNGIIKREWPIPLWQQIQVCNAAFSIEELISKN